MTVESREVLSQAPYNSLIARRNALRTRAIGIVLLDNIEQAMADREKTSK